MLTPEDLISYKKKPPIPVFSLGQKNSNFDPEFLNMKLDNMEELLSVQRVKMLGQVSKGIWRPDINKAEIVHKTGPVWDTIGHYVDSRLYVHPEEALYLVDTSALELSFNNVTFSLQRAYHLLLHETNISLDFYRVYCYLSLLGYKVIRHCVKNILTRYEQSLEIHKIGIKHRDVKTDFIPSVCELSSRDSIQPVEKHPENDVDNTECEILSRLRENGPGKFARENSLNPTRVPDFDIYQPDITHFRKSTVQLPNFRIIVCNSSEKVENFVFSSFPNGFSDNVPLILAIVYPDFINFLQICTVSLPVLI